VKAHATRAAVASLAGVSLWAAGGTLALTDPGGPRIGVLPPLWTLALLLAAAMAVAFVSRGRGRWLPLLVSALAVLPWLPGPVPAAFLIWTRPLLFLVGGAVLLAALFQALRRRAFTGAFADPRRAPYAAAAITLALYGLAAWRVAPMIPGGDEPHYLVITQSLLYDFDLQIENNHARGDYREYVAIDLRPDFVQRGTDGAIYSIHMPGVSAIVAPAFLIAGHPGAAAFIVLLSALAGALLWRVAFMVTAEAGAAWFGWAAVALSVPIVFHGFTLYPDSASTLAVMIGVLGLLRASAQPAPVSRWILYGTALALLPWLHSRLALLAGGLGVMTVLRLWRATRQGGDATAAAGHAGPASGGPQVFWRAAAAFLAVPVVSAAGWFGYFWIIYGSPNPQSQYGTLLDAISSPWFITSGIGGLLFDQQFGLLTHAPVYACGLIGLAIMIARGRRLSTGRSGPGTARLAIEILLLILPYTITTTTMRMWWGGWSAPARFLVPLLPLLGIAAAVAWLNAGRRATRAVMIASLALSAAMTATLVWVDRGRLAYDIRQTDALWLEWAGPLTNLARGIPTFLRSPEPAAWLQTLVWIAALVAAWLLVRSADGRLVRTRGGLAAILAAAGAVAGMLALSIVWRLNLVTGLQPAPAQMDLLRAVAERRGVGVVFDPLSRITVDDIPPALTIIPAERHLGGRDGQIMAVPGPIPAGAYELQPYGQFGLAALPPGERDVPPKGSGPSGQLSAGIGREFVPLWRMTVEDAATLTVDYPVNVRAIVLRGDEQAAGTVLLASISPLRITPADRLPTRDFARQAVRYGTTTVYFMDEGAFPEPEAFWVRGRNSAAVVLHPDASRRAAPLFLRNAPVPNTLTIEAGRWREDMTLAPGEERRIEIPVDRARNSMLVRLTSASGFRPSEVTASRDERFLGVWVKVE